MSKKEEQYRVEGIQMAYHILKEAKDKEEALRKLEARLTKSQKLNMPVLIRDKELKDFEETVKQNTMTSILAITLMVLRDKFGFGSERGNRFCNEFIELSDIIYGGWLEWDSDDPQQPGIIQYIQSEMRCDIREYLKFAAGMLADTERTLDMREEFLENRQKWLKKLKQPWQRYGIEKI